MLKKVIILIIIIGLGCFAYQYFRQLSETKDEVSLLLKNLKQETGINFSEIRELEMEWAEAILEGKGFEARRIPSEQYDNIKLFLEDNGFTVSGLTGHKKDQIVCTVEGQWIPLEPDIYDITVKCGKKDMVETKNNESFSVVLEANPTTGYQWELDFDSDYIQLLDTEYVPTSPELIGSGGQETFNFLALKSGKTEITFSYLRVWEKDKPPIKKKFYEIIIK